ncbi:MAG TPA: anti-sigma factor [Acidimicrobiales bacterium]|nr:anti-sigma factor [Acidimicrobiales bacterium]
MNSPQQSHDSIEELLGAYALDAVEDDERHLVAAHLTTCARCRAEVEQHREVAAMLAYSGEPAPDGIWDRIAENLEAAPPAPALPLFSAPRRPDRSTRPAWVTRAGGGLLAVAASVVIAVLAFQVRDLNEQINRVEHDLAIEAVERGYQTAIASGDSVRVDLVSADGSIDARAVLSRDGVGFLRGTTLPRLPDDRTYQLWGVTPDLRAVSLGVFGPAPDYAAFSVSGEFIQLAITEEQAGGVISSEQPLVVYGSIDREA